VRSLVVLLALVGACGESREHATHEVPARYRDVRASAGHVAHVGKVECSACHDADFHAPAPELCATCHASVATPLHRAASAPTCRQCHDFGTGTRAPQASCAQCHTETHGDQPCVQCHAPHASATAMPACTDCHAEQQTLHGGVRGCRDCHRMHETVQRANESCARCHTAKTAATSTGHPACTGCHAPHDFATSQVAACTSCHAGQPMLGHERCTQCHDPHDDAPKPCASCHRDQVKHPTPCITCHPVHDASLAATRAKARPCDSCHLVPHHATARCLDCHTPHAGRPQPSATLCATCHAG